jgi:hypothetical protein
MKLSESIIAVLCPPYDESKCGDTPMDGFKWVRVSAFRHEDCQNCKREEACLHLSVLPVAYTFLAMLHAKHDCSWPIAPGGFSQDKACYSYARKPAGPPFWFANSPQFQ